LKAGSELAYTQEGELNFLNEKETIPGPEKRILLSEIAVGNQLADDRAKM